jgi:hypothetical protein
MLGDIDEIIVTLGILAVCLAVARAIWKYDGRKK